MKVSRSRLKSIALRSNVKSSSLRSRAKLIRRSLHRLPGSSLLLVFIEAGGDPSIFCYRMGVDILSAGRARFLAPAPWVANLATLTLEAAQRPQRTRNQVACSNLFSTFSARFSTPKD
jgi:hypothetical protein